MGNKLLHDFCDNIKRCNCDKIHMVPPAFMHSAIGIADECGEITEILKRALYYGDPIDDEHLIEEYGDLMFYIMLDCMRIGESIGGGIVIFESALHRNIVKLKKRYKEGFTEAEATESGRDHAAEQEAMSRIHNLMEQPDLEDLGRGERIKNGEAKKQAT